MKTLCRERASFTPLHEAAGSCKQSSSTSSTHSTLRVRSLSPQRRKTEARRQKSNEKQTERKTTSPGCGRETHLHFVPTHDMGRPNPILFCRLTTVLDSFTRIHLGNALASRSLCETHLLLTSTNAPPADLELPLAMRRREFESTHSIPDLTPGQPTRYAFGQ